EPAAGLNATESANLSRLIREIQRQGATIILVEHHMDVVMSVCDTITVLNYGRKLAEGPPSAIQGNAEVIEAYLGHGQEAPLHGGCFPSSPSRRTFASAPISYATARSFAEPWARCTSASRALPSGAGRKPARSPAASSRCSLLAAR